MNNEKFRYEHIPGLILILIVIIGMILILSLNTQATIYGWDKDWNKTEAKTLITEYKTLNITSVKAIFFRDYCGPTQYGKYFINTKTIIICRPARSLDDKRQSLYHELGHHFWYENNITFAEGQAIEKQLYNLRINMGEIFYIKYAYMKNPIEEEYADYMSQHYQKKLYDRGIINYYPYPAWTYNYYPYPAWTYRR